MKEVHSESIHLQESCYLIKQTGALVEECCAVQTALFLLN